MKKYAPIVAPNDAGHTASNGAEQDAADHRQKKPDRDGEGDRADIERHVAGNRGCFVRRDEIPERFVMADESSRTIAAGASPCR